MLTSYETEILAAVRTKIRTLPGITKPHAYELEHSFDLVVHAFNETPEQLATWSHMTFVIDAEMFQIAGWDVSDLTKDEIDSLADAMKDCFVGGKSWDRAIEYAAGSFLERVIEEDEDESEDECACCAQGAFNPSADGDCYTCGHEHTDHEGANHESQA